MSTTTSHFYEKTGLLSGFDPHSKNVTLSYILRTLMAAYARINNRIVGDNVRFFGTLTCKQPSQNVNDDQPVEGCHPICRFKLPKQATKVMLWSPGYKLVPPSNVRNASETAKNSTESSGRNDVVSDMLSMDLRVVRQSTQEGLLPRFHRETDNTIDDVYVLHADVPSSKDVNGEHYFYIVYYEIDGRACNAYLSFFVENLNDDDKRNHLKNLAEYVKHLASGNINYGEFFNVFEPTAEKTLVVKERKLNRPLTTPSLSTTQDGHEDFIVLMVNKLESKSRRGGALVVTYETAYVDDLEQVSPCLLKYIRAIHASGLLNLPAVFPPTPGWKLVVNDLQPSNDQFAVEKKQKLITIFGHESTSTGRHLDRITVADANIGRLLFGTDGQWLLTVIQTGTRFKSPGNGSILQHLCNRCSDDVNVRMICSQLANEVDGVYNDFIGLSTATIENAMIVNADFVRTSTEIAFSYRRLTDIETAHAYYANFAGLLRLMASLRTPESDYFVNVLQKPMPFTGKRKNAEGFQDSTKLMAIMNNSKLDKVIRDKDTGKVIMVDKVDGGVFYELRKQFITEDNKGLLCPFSKEILEVNDVINGLGNVAPFITPVTLVKASGQQVSLTPLNKHTPLIVKLTPDGQMFPERAVLFKNDADMLAKMPFLREQTLAYMNSKRFLEKLTDLVSSPGEYKVACEFVRRLSPNGPLNIYELMPYSEAKNTTLWACPFCVNAGLPAGGECSCVESRIPRLYANFVTNCSKQYAEYRKSLLTPLQLIELMKASAGHLKLLDEAKKLANDLENLATGWTEAFNSGTEATKERNLLSQDALKLAERTKKFVDELAASAYKVDGIVKEFSGLVEMVKVLDRDLALNCARLWKLAKVDMKKLSEDAWTAAGVAKTLAESLSTVIIPTIEFRPIDRINAFILATDWRKPTFHQQLALAASVLHAKRAIALNDAGPPFTEAVWLNFGLPLTMVHESGDLLMRTMAPCLSEKANCVQMLLARNKWSFVAGNVPREATSINTARNQYTEKPNFDVQKGEYKGRAGSVKPTTTVGGVVISGQQTFLDAIRLAIMNSAGNSFFGKPAIRALIMRTLTNCPERESLLSIPLSRKEEHHVSLKEYLYRVRVQLPESFVIDGKVYRTAQYKTDNITDYLDAL